MSIYVASSWRNEEYPGVVVALRDAGHDVYDFRNPRAGDRGFHWGEIDPAWRHWCAQAFVEALAHPLAEAGFRSDMDALRAAEAVVLVLPCGRSAHLEAGWGAGAGKPVYIYSPPSVLSEPEAELMYKMTAGVTDDIGRVIEWLAPLAVRKPEWKGARA